MRRSADTKLVMYHQGGRAPADAGRYAASLAESSVVLTMRERVTGSACRVFLRVRAAEVIRNATGLKSLLAHARLCYPSLAGPFMRKYAP
jgi:hypothetical protein